MSVSLPVIVGTVREDNATRPVAAYVRTRLEAHEEVQTTLIDPEQLELGNLRRRLDEDDLTSQAEERFLATVKEADGFVLVTPEYNHGYPGALKNLIDHTYDPWYRKAFGLVTTGGSSGGVRAEDQLRVVINGGLGGAVVPRGVNVPRVRDTFGEEGPVEDEATWRRRVDRLVDELAAYARAMRDVRGTLGT